MMAREANATPSQKLWEPFHFEIAATEYMHAESLSRKAKIMLSIKFDKM